MISEFYINGLFGERNIRIPFDSNYKIIVSENGCGKTTVLNALYALLSGNISKLQKISFSDIGIIFTDETNISFSKSEFETNLGLFHEHSFLRDLESELGTDFIFELIDEAREYPTHRLEQSLLFKQASDILGVPIVHLREILRRQTRVFRENKPLSSETQGKLDDIKERFSFETLCLPTYRRVEEDIRAFSSISDAETFRHSSINFGMRDVKKSIDEITKEILNSSNAWFSKVNGEMLSQLVSGFEVSEDMRKSISVQTVEIVLARIGKNIPDPQKQQILNLVSNDNTLKAKEHEPLVYFVANLLKVYKEQQENDTAIQSFVSVSNKYLGDKEIIYDESNVTVKVIRKKGGKLLDFEYLSSGEKQIISLFSLLYLKKKHDAAIFFDEPELSLSMEWQKTLLPDIIKSERCKFLFCATHSPFIFENELIKYTVDLNEYIEEL